MKTYLLFIFCVLFSLSANSQTYTVSFDESTRLINVLKSGVSGSHYPTILFKPTIVLDLSKIYAPGTVLYKGIIDFAGKSIPVHGNNTFLNSQAAIQQAVVGTIGTELRTLSTTLITATPRKDTALVEYNTSSKYLPIKIKTDKRSTIKVASRFYTDPVNSSKDVSATLALDGNSYQKVEYDIIRSETDNQILAQHLANTKNHYNGIPASYEGLLRTTRKAFWRHGRVINELLLKDSLDSKTFNIDVVRELDQLKNTSKHVPKIYDNVLTKNEEWIKSWLWYTGGEVRLNPFDVTADTTQIISRLDEQIADLEAEVKIWESHSIINTTDPANFDAVKRAISSISAHVQELKSLRVSATKLGSKFKAWIAQRTIESRVLYSGTWHASSEKRIQWMHHYDANNEFKLTPKQDKLPSMVADADQVVVYVHNVKAGDKIKLTSSTEKFQPKSPFEETVEEIANQFGTIAQGQALSRIVGVLAPRTGIRPLSAGSLSNFQGLMLGKEKNKRRRSTDLCFRCNKKYNT